MRSALILRPNLRLLGVGSLSLLPGPTGRPVDHDDATDTEVEDNHDEAELHELRLAHRPDWNGADDFDDFVANDE